MTQPGEGADEYYANAYMAAMLGYYPIAGSGSSMYVKPDDKGRRARVAKRLGSDAAESDYLPLRVGGHSEHPGLIYDIPGQQYYSDPSLHPALQDLGDLIVADLSEACGALDDPDMEYDGVNFGPAGWEPVSDEHVSLVIWGAQRELDRELRHLKGNYAAGVRPSVTLADLPRRVQRAYAERRRLRYLQWGIDHDVWERGLWRLGDVPADPEWGP